MKWHKTLYCGTSIEQVQWARFQIIYGKKSKKYYCIALSDQNENLLDIYESRFLRTTHLNTDDIYIVGIAKEKIEAYEVVRQIIEDVYIHTGGFNIREFLGI